MFLEKFNSKEIEEKILEFWESEKIYEEIKKNEPKNKVWRFIDGPPYTTGDVHLGTAWNKILKDYLIKYKRMRGYRVTDTQTEQEKAVGKGIILVEYNKYTGVIINHKILYRNES